MRWRIRTSWTPSVRGGPCRRRPNRWSRCLVSARGEYIVLSERLVQFGVADEHFEPVLPIELEVAVEQADRGRGASSGAPARRYEWSGMRGPEPRRPDDERPSN